jgi:hypothetical protein
MRVRIDEARGDDHSAGVDDALRWPGEASADRPDPIAGDRDVAGEGCIRTGIDRPAPDQQVDGLNRGRRGGAHGRQRQAKKQSASSCGTPLHPSPAFRGGGGAQAKLGR